MATQKIDPLSLESANAAADLSAKQFFLGLQDSSRREMVVARIAPAGIR